MAGKDIKNICVWESKPNKFYTERDTISFLLASFSNRPSTVTKEWNQFPHRFVLLLENRVRLRMLDRYLCTKEPFWSRCFSIEALAE